MRGLVPYFLKTLRYLRRWCAYILLAFLILQTPVRAQEIKSLIEQTLTRVISARIEFTRAQTILTAYGHFYLVSPEFLHTLAGILAITEDMKNNPHNLPVFGMEENLSTTTHNELTKIHTKFKIASNFVERKSLQIAFEELAALLKRLPAEDLITNLPNLLPSEPTQINKVLDKLDDIFRYSYPARFNRRPFRLIDEDYQAYTAIVVTTLIAVLLMYYGLSEKIDQPPSFFIITEAEHRNIDRYLSRAEGALSELMEMVD